MDRSESRWSQAEPFLAAADPRLARVIAASGPCTLKPQRQSPYEALCRAVAHQQLHGKAAQTILSRFLGLYPEETFPSPGRLLATPPARIRACGFSESKVLALRDIAAKADSGLIPDRRTCARLEDEQIIERLTQARGVGRWTVQMFLMFTLCRPDVLPVDDFGIREGYRLMHRMDEQPKPRALADSGQVWAPWRSVASWYLWRAVALYR